MTLRLSAGGATLSLLLLWQGHAPGAARAQAALVPPPPKDASPAAVRGGKGSVLQPAAQVPEGPKVRVFHLRYREAQLALDLARQLFDVATPPNNPTGQVVQFLPPGGVPVQVGVPAIAGMPGMPGGFGGMGRRTNTFLLPGSFGPPRFYVPEKSRTIIMRGTKQDVAAMADLIAVLDLPPGKARPQTKELGVFDLRFAKPEAITDALNQLGIHVRSAVVTETRTLIVRGAEADIRDIGLVIEALDRRQEP